MGKLTAEFVEKYKIRKDTSEIGSLQEVLFYLKALQQYIESGNISKAYMFLKECAEKIKQIEAHILKNDAVLKHMKTLKL